MPYTPRILDRWLDEFQPALAAVEIHGPKGVGKTASAQRRAHSVLSLDDPADRELITADPGLLRRWEAPVLLDEWQRLPQLWDSVRRDVDDRGEPGRYLLTGSAAPRGVPVHSGAGRIIGVRMRPLSLAERGVAVPTVSLAALRAGDTAVEGATDITLATYVDEIVASGFPGIRALPPALRGTHLNSYLDAVVLREFPEQGLTVRRPQVLRAWLRAFAAATSSTASYNAILDAATPGQGDKPAKTTTIAYRDVLESLWLLDEVEAWLPTQNLMTRLGQAPKHQLADPALAARLLGIDRKALLAARPAPGAELRRGTILGALFEHLVTLSVRVYAGDASVQHLRTRNGDREVDLVVVRPDGSVIAIEVKLAATITDADVRHLTWLRSQIGDDLVAAIVVTTGRHAYRRSDGVLVVPFALLGP